jgi:nucleoside-diphosphate-sugar epimerase
MKVLVTGHRGYIGVEMVPALRAAGHEVVGLDTGYYDECDFESPPDPTPELKVDLTADHLRGIDAVAHLAALSNDPLGDLNKELTYDINLHASVKLARAAKEAGVPRFLFSSSCSLYGAGGDGFCDETSAFFPQTAYGESKVKVEQEVSGLADAKFTPVYLRNATAYGVSRRLRADIVVNNQAFNVGRKTENFRIREVAETVAAVVPNSEVSFAAGASADTRDYRVDFGKIEAKLPGYKPTWTLRKGVEELYAAYKKHGMTKEEWQGPRYYRLKTIKGLQDRGLIDGNLRPVKA